MGTLYFLNEEKFEGEFLNNLANGKGIIYSKFGNINGYWKNNKLLIETND